MGINYGGKEDWNKLSKKKKMGISCGGKEDWNKLTRKRRWE